MEQKRDMKKEQKNPLSWSDLHCPSCKGSKKFAPRIISEWWDFVRCCSCFTTWCIGCHSKLMFDVRSYISMNKEQPLCVDVCYSCHSEKSKRFCEDCKKQVDVLKLHDCEKFCCVKCFDMHDDDMCQQQTRQKINEFVQTCLFD